MSGNKKKRSRFARMLCLLAFYNNLEPLKREDLYFDAFQYPHTTKPITTKNTHTIIYKPPRVVKIWVTFLTNGSSFPCNSYHFFSWPPQPLQDGGDCSTSFPKPLLFFWLSYRRSYTFISGLLPSSVPKQEQKFLFSQNLQFPLFFLGQIAALWRKKITFDSSTVFLPDSISLRTTLVHFLPGALNSFFFASSIWKRHFSCLKVTHIKR